MKHGANLYAPARRRRAGRHQVDRRQGYVEKSNVNSVSEMSRMVEVMRTYTAASPTCCSSKATCTRSAIEKLADVPA